MIDIAMKGDFVVCIHKPWYKWIPGGGIPNDPEFGKIYRVRETMKTHFIIKGKKEFGVAYKLEEIEHPKLDGVNEGGWDCRYFKRITNITDKKQATEKIKETV